MRRADVLMALLVRHVNPRESEQDWQLIASLFYTLTGLLVPATRVEQRYYDHLRAHGSRAALEAAAAPFVGDLSAELRLRAASRIGDRCAADSAAAAIPPAAAPRRPRPEPQPFVARPGPGPGPEAAPAPKGAAGAPASPFPASPIGPCGGEDDAGGCAGDKWLAKLSRLSPEQRQRWRQLRQDPVSPEILLALLQRFTLVEGSAVFLAPVHPSTVMEFNGIRSGPYDTVVMFPMSLVVIKQHILASRRDYELRKRQAQASAATAATPAYFLPDNEETVNPRKRGRVAAAATAATTTAASVSKRDGSTTEGAGGANAHAAEDANMGAILTLQGLERAVWQITANCVVFNAPESYYPSTARQFANACVEIIDQYCMQRLSTA